MNRELNLKTFKSFLLKGFGLTRNKRCASKSVSKETN